MMKAARERLGLSLAVTTVRALLIAWVATCVTYYCAKDRQNTCSAVLQNFQGGGDTAQKVQHKQKIQAILSDCHGRVVYKV